MKTLLVAFDGSESAMRALDHAIERAKASPDLSIHLLTTHENPVYYPEIGLHVSYDRLMELATQEAAKVQEPAEQRLKSAGVRYTKEIAAGHAPQLIADHAGKNGVGEVVMGTRGLGAFKNLLMGSVASQVVHAVHVPVTLVK